MNLREPNKSIVVDGFPLPHMEEIFTELRGAMLFSTLYLQSAYYQVTLHEDSCSLTTFTTHDKLFHFKQVQFSPALSLFNPELPTVVTTDASDYGLGAVLT